MRCVRLSGESYLAGCTSVYTFCTAGIAGVVQPLAYGTKCFWNGTVAAVASGGDRRCALRTPSATPTRTPTPSVTPSTGSSPSASPAVTTPSPSPTPMFSLEYTCAGRNDGMYCARNAGLEAANTTSVCSKAFFYCANSARQMLQPVTLGTTCYLGSLIFETDERCSHPFAALIRLED
jgi:hypothetical protein